jgi:hypothetical protein
MWLFYTTLLNTFVAKIHIFIFRPNTSMNYDEDKKVTLPQDRLPGSFPLRFIRDSSKFF